MGTPAGANAPYKIEKRGDKWVVLNNTGAVKATFDDPEKARDYQKALYANVSGAPKRAGKVAFTGKAKDRVKAAFETAVERVVAARKPIALSVDGEEKYPILTQSDAEDAWKLRNHGKGVSEEQVVAHIRRACKALGLKFPGSDRETAAHTDQTMTYQLRPHGFVFPLGMPPCAVCNEGPNEGSHVNPPRTTGQALNDNNWGVMVRREAAFDHLTRRKPRRTHVYTTGAVGWLSNINCAACKQPMSASAHTPGMPVSSLGGTLGAGVDVSPRATAADADPSAGQIVMAKHKFDVMDGQDSQGNDYKLCRLCGFPEDDPVHELDADGQAQEPKVVLKQTAQVVEPEPYDYVPTPVGSRELAELERQTAFVTQLGGKIILSAPATVLTDPAALPRELAAEWERTSSANPHFQWLQGRYVEADKPNRNKAMWTAEDLEFGEPSVAHGPINMLHAERHIVGTVAGARMVQPEREAAAAGETNVIHALGAIWRYLFPTEARQIARASDDRTLWYSMECVSREVACLAPDCNHVQSYRDYMLNKHLRCHHVKEGAPRRFKEPTFDGAGIIIPPIRPGWAGASATVMRQAAMLAERHESRFAGLTEEQAVSMVAQIIRFAGGTAT